MAEKKRPSVAEILAAARKADGGGGDQPASKPSPAASEEPTATPVEPVAGEAAAPPAAEKPQPPTKPAGAKPAAGGRPSVAEMMAMARAGGAAGAKPAAEKAAPVEKAAAKAAPKPAAAPKEKAPEPVVSGEKETASILAAARSGAKPGPMSKAEAAKLHPAGAEKPAKAAASKLVVPPMPVKPDYAKPKPKKGEEELQERRWFMSVVLGSFLATGFTAMATTFGLWLLGTARFMFPNILTEPPSKFKVGFPAEFPPGSVEEKYKALFGVWIINTEYKGKPEIFALRTVCTHLGCTPNWLEGEQKFKCPCHGSGFYKDGINFEGPAPRPLERYAIRLADDGQLEVDKSKLFLEEKGQWTDAASFYPV